MTSWLRRPVTFTNARVVTVEGLASSIRVASTVLDVDTAPRPGDVVVDLEGAVVLPGLINAHDHLELNHYGPLKARDRYENAIDWIADLRPRLRADASIRRNAGYPLADRLFVGGLKNLLAGVTTVAHHNPRYGCIGGRFPVRVLKRYGWAHSFAMEREPVGARGEPGGIVKERCAATPLTQPFVVHVGEGTDERAALELSRFEREACLRPNSVMVHGVAHTPDTWRTAAAAGVSLVWCPSSNGFLFGQTVPLAALLDAVPGSAVRVCLGSDSRLTGARDLLDELRHAAALMPRRGALLPMVTSAAARAMQLDRAGRLAVGAPADLAVVPPSAAEPDDPERALLAARRSDVRLVMIGGRPMVGDHRTAGVFRARDVRTAHLCVDGVERLASRSLVSAIARCPITEPGVEPAA